MTSGARRVTDYLDAAEIRELTTASDAHGFAALLTTWMMIAASFAVVAWHPSVLTVIVALIVLGGRQLALAILMHEAAHRSLFRTRRLNLVLGEWLCAAPVWGSLERYRKHHLRHHAHTNTDADPDLGLITPFPITRASLLRKFARDLLGLTGLRRVLGLLAIDFGLLSYTASTGARRLDQTGRSVGDVIACGARNFGPVLISNATLALLLRASGHGSLYFLWVGAYLTTFSLFVRVRAIAEHACTQRSVDPFAEFGSNTRTTRAGLLARITVAPHNVNFHLEHHLLPTVPQHSLARMHRMLSQRGALDSQNVALSYLDTLRLVTSRSDS
ncbi:MAG TPA: fatty acid desaturase family protein [Enhygromyxa sp.]|nr:fatty acid desaturase family protein [Enhygromyxa sp.]